MRLWTALVGLVLAATAPAHAQQNYPEQAIKIVVPFAPGGSPDIVARFLGPQMTQMLGKQVYVENRPGAAGTMAAKGVADADANGYTLLMTTVSTQAIAPALFPNLPYDPVTNFAPVSLIANVPLVLVTDPSLPAKDLKELIALLKANPGKYTFASSGVGAPLHLAGELFKSLTGTEVTHVPNRGSGPALNRCDRWSGHDVLRRCAVHSAACERRRCQGAWRGDAQPSCGHSECTDHP